MTTATFTTDNNEAFTVQLDDGGEIESKYLHHCYIIGGAFVVCGEYNTSIAFDIVGYNVVDTVPVQQQRLQPKKSRRILQIIQITNNKKDIHISTTYNTSFTLYVLACDNKYGFKKKYSNHQILLENNVNQSRRRLVHYIDALVSHTPVELATLDRSDVEIISYGTCSEAEGRESNPCSFASRVLMKWNPINFQKLVGDDSPSNIFSNIIVANVRSAIDYPEPGTVALYAKNKALMFYFQFITLKNVSRSFKRPRAADDDDEREVKRPKVDEDEDEDDDDEPRPDKRARGDDDESLRMTKKTVVGK